MHMAGLGPFLEPSAPEVRATLTHPSTLHWGETHGPCQRRRRLAEPDFSPRSGLLAWSAARQVDANRRDELSVETELEVFVCVDPNTFHHSSARFPWLMQESTDFSQYQSNVVMRGCVCARVGFSGCTEIWYVGIVGLFQAACGNNERKRP